MLRTLKWDSPNPKSDVTPKRFQDLTLKPKVICKIKGRRVVALLVVAAGGTGGGVARGVVY